MKSGKPRIALMLGDPAGIGPELVARLMADPAAMAMAVLLLIADRAELERSMTAAPSHIWAACRSMPTYPSCP